MEMVKSMDKPAAATIKVFAEHPILRSTNMLQEAVKGLGFSKIPFNIINPDRIYIQAKGSNLTIKCVHHFMTVLKHRLESHLGPNGRICYITSEMFYIEVNVKKNGHVAIVKLAHHGESPMMEVLQKGLNFAPNNRADLFQTLRDVNKFIRNLTIKRHFSDSDNIDNNDITDRDTRDPIDTASVQICKDLLQLLRAKDFEGFGQSLEGLLQMYSIPGNSDVKAKVYSSLCNLEEDLTALFNLSRSTNDNRIATILDGKVGFLSPRSGGTPMNIEYYIAPDQIPEEKQIPDSRVVGSNVSVTVTGTTNYYQLPVCPLIQNISQGDGSVAGSSSPSDESCISLPACFFLKFDNPEPVLLSLIQKIQNITGLPVISTKQSLLHKLVIGAKHKCMEDLADKEVQFAVSLSGGEDQCFVLNSRLDKENGVIGALVKKIPFIHPNHVPSILEVLRHQAAYNTLLNSCISGTINPTDHTNMLHFEVSLEKDLKITISFQHPNGASLCCVVVDVLSCRRLVSSVYTGLSDPPSPWNTEFIVKVLKSSMSIPLTMNTIFKTGQEMNVSEHKEIKSANESNVLSPIFPECQEEDVIQQPHSTPQTEEPTCTNIPKNEDNEQNEGTLPNAEDSGRVQSLELQESGSSETLELSASYTEEIYFIHSGIGPSGVEEHNSSVREESANLAEKHSVTEESYSSLAEEPSVTEESNSNLAEEPSSSLIQELSPIMPEDPSPNDTEDTSSSMSREQSLSITEEPNTSIPEEPVPRSMFEHEIDESY
ncbi:mediator of RNA polymerase II transcription subunit 1-like [Anomaloglossus baeobatrachus]|uniref:mediator of RNA polymerase II transcription subunit 1-like n=1 Tax=Anomaloglossus baeobatrachus TaxID=238106 RepID=UPI003F50B281